MKLRYCMNRLHEHQMYIAESPPAWASAGARVQGPGSSVHLAVCVAT